MKILVLLPLMLVPAAWADEKPIEKIPPELRSCLSIERNTERLACFDRGAAVLLGTTTSEAPSPESSFGMVASTPRANSVKVADAPEDVKTVRGRVASVSEAADGASLITLDNGQAWRQISGGSLLLRVGDEVEINRAALGSFQMIVPSGRSGKVKRVR
jgi:hypothetical protein